MMTRGRFAPTPSGELHIGNALAALLAWLQIRKENGTFVLRIEDLDRPRCRPEYARQMVGDLKWLGLDWDEGPDVGGDFGPYVQSERDEFYIKAFERLLRKGKLYPCFCSRKELRRLASAPHGLASLGPEYPGTCRNLSAADQERKSKFKRPSYRFAMPERPIDFEDKVMGHQSYPPGSGGDFVVKRADGIMSYQLAVVVDDAAMGITDVLRGADLLDSTLRQILLYEALNLPAPKFTHVPLLYGPDGRRLSKRHGDWITIAKLRKKGMSPESLVGLLASLCDLIEKPEPLKPRDLIACFDTEALSSEPINLSSGFLSQFPL
jgi:glutamyl-tRNA synthetase